MSEATKKGAAAAAPAPLTYKLKTPVSDGGELVTEIDYRRPKGRDMRAWMNGKGGAGDDLLALMVNLAERPASFFDALDGEDFMGFSDVLSDFLKAGRTTSTT
ncbi:MAG: phage tail assembly protein [Hyphomicrobiaceae bacterium]|nr:phage tail assembly protein [Hyphomicrobiaceae bacterium]